MKTGGLICVARSIYSIPVATTKMRRSVPAGSGTIALEVQRSFLDWSTIQMLRN